MAEYIDREAAIGMAVSGRIRALPTTEDGEDWIRVEEVRESLKRTPAADVRPMRWIPVTERLPENDDHVLVCTRTKSGSRNIVIGYYMDGMWRCGMNSNVTHWMELPEVPHGE